MRRARRSRRLQHKPLHILPTIQYRTTITQLLVFEKDFFANILMIRILQREECRLSVAPLRALIFWGGLSTTGSLALAGSVTRGYVCWALRALCLKTVGLFSFWLAHEAEQ